jgi:hypothetical protein
MAENKTNREINKSLGSYTTWYQRIFSYSFSNKTFIVPWQIYDSEYETEHTEENGLLNK